MGRIRSQICKDRILKNRSTNEKGLLILLILMKAAAAITKWFPHRWALHPISVISDIGLKRAKTNIISDIGMNVYPISYIWHPLDYRTAQWLNANVLACEDKEHRFDPRGYVNKLFDIGYQHELWCRCRNPSDVGMTVSVQHIFFRYQNNSCRCRMSDIANIKIDVDAHLWFP